MQRHLPGHARARCAPTRGELGLEVRTEPADAERLPFADESFDLVLGHAVLHHIPDLQRALRRVRARARARRHGRCSPASPRATATAWRACPSASPARSRRCGAARSARAPRRADDERRLRRGARGRRRRARVRARRAAGQRARRGLRATCASAARSCSRTGSAGPTARSRRPPTPTTCRGPGASTPTAATWCCRSSTARLLESRLPPAIFYNLMLTARKPARLGADGTVIDSGACPTPLAAASRCSRSGIVALPSESVPLHIFEDRYRRMIEHCLEARAGSPSASSGSCGCPTRSSSRSAARARSSRCSSAWTTAA